MQKDRGEAKRMVAGEATQDGRAALGLVAKWWGPAVASRVASQFAATKSFTADDVCRAVFHARRDLAVDDVEALADVEEMRFTSQVRRVRKP